MDSNTQTNAKWARALPWILGLGLLGFFWFFALTRYNIRAYSDSYNWLMFAYHFREQLAQSRWPYGFPLLLNLALRLTGPIYIFLINLPVLTILFLLAAKLGCELRDKDGDAAFPPPWAGLMVLIPVVAADATNFLNYINPYRDPLSYVLLFTSAWVFIRAVTRRRPAILFAAGALLGMACSVREPSILMLLPMTLYGLVEWRLSGGELRFWRSVLSFATGFVLLLLPFLAQTYLTTSQLVLPPQASIESSVVPGAYFTLESMNEVANKAWIFYAGSMPWLLWGAGLGCVVALFRRNRVVLLLILPAIVTFAIFYMFYWTFVPRYFYVVTLLMCIVTGYGLHALLRILLSRLPPLPRHAVAAVLLAVLSVLAGREIFQRNPPGTPFQAGHARAFVEDIHPLLPENAVILAPRHMCELLELLTRRTSYPLPVYADSGEKVLPELRDHVLKLMAEDRPVYTVEMVWPDAPHGDTAPLRRMFEVQRLKTFKADDYRLRHYASPEFYLCRVVPGTRQEVEFPIPMQDAGMAWIAVDAGDPVAMEGGDDTVLFLDGDRTAEQLTQHGTCYVALDPVRPGSMVTAKVVRASGSSLPGMVSLQTEPLYRPVDIRFDFYEDFNHQPRWSGEVLAPTAGNRVPLLHGTARFLVPVPAPDRGHVLMEWRMRSNRLKAGQEHRLSFREGDTELGDAVVPCDRKMHSVLIPLPPRQDTRERTIELVRHAGPGDSASPSGPLPDAVEAHRLILHRIGSGDRLDIRIGSMEDTPYIREGFHTREGLRTGEPYRWTSDQAVLQLPLIPPSADMRLRIHFAPAPTQEQGADAHPAVVFNDVAIQPEQVSKGNEGLIWQGLIPSSSVSTTNIVKLNCKTWKPAETGSRDQRSLGIRVNRIELFPVR